MSVLQRIMAAMFGWEYVLLIHHDSTFHVRRAYRIGGDIFADSYLPSTRAMLLEGGEVRGPSYVKAWRPITRRSLGLWRGKEAA